MNDSGMGIVGVIVGALLVGFFVFFVFGNSMGLRGGGKGCERPRGSTEGAGNEVGLHEKGASPLSVVPMPRSEPPHRRLRVSAERAPARLQRGRRLLDAA